MAGIHAFFFFFFFNDTATTEIYTLSLHDALPIFLLLGRRCGHLLLLFVMADPPLTTMYTAALASVKETKTRSEEHTSELQSRLHLVCRLLLEKKKPPI